MFTSEHLSQNNGQQDCLVDFFFRKRQQKMVAYGSL